ncbi:poly(ADP-ribose) glycohydrolase [Marchantia polymorpha subsp. ruderalis]|uniref:poly(ADP-ribose) glycohydrolase n=2 Tax=Marchantia polymorpha TaxID=3197 RepID=A0AAF6BZH4_MARPO|nr:hypothetical protein MARPO_0009s0113 [Marchantia polymorpha]BBN17408.1 hypothetical protein Mp_7g14280 [Marchantia polymorpha subsp. ruderalis]|eukprot:PTQ47012.1 hypothetical protein MARPO_0009s0113 [Marchantia polymorpha]
MSAFAFSSIAPYLPLQRDPASGDLRWVTSVEYALKAVARGVDTSLVCNGQALCDCIVDMRAETGQCKDFAVQYAKSLGLGLSHLFDALEDAEKFFSSTLPGMAKLAIQLPELLKAHGEQVDRISGGSTTLRLRILNSQQSGMVLLDQGLIAALLSCGFFCLFPGALKERKRDDIHPINFDFVFIGVPYARNQIQKLKCLIHYFEKVCSSMPQGTVSYERKILPRRRPSPTKPLSVFPNENFWKNSKRSLCNMKVVDFGAIESAGPDYLQVDFANAYLGGGALNQGCVQEEIRFMINPELIAGMLFMSPMANNEAIEITGAQQYSQYKGYASSFVFAGDFVDRTPTDSWGRRMTCITAIDALCAPGENQFDTDAMIREVNKAFCGFLRHSPVCGAVELWKPFNVEEANQKQASNVSNGGQANADQQIDFRNASDESTEEDRKSVSPSPCAMHQEQKGIATGNWGSGAFGGNLELKSLLQWIAASEAGRAEVLYYSFRDPRAKRLQEVIDWVLQEGWTGSELWTVLVEYGQCRLNRQVKCELYDWILPNPTRGKTLRSKTVKFKSTAEQELRENLMQDKICTDPRLMRSSSTRKARSGCWCWF